MPSGIPTPRFTTELIFSSIAARRAMTLRASSAVAPGPCDAARTSPAYAGLYFSANVCIRIARDDDPVDEDPRDLDVTRRQDVVGGDAFNLHDHDSAGVLRCLRDREPVQGGGLALHGHVALVVGGRAAQEGHIDRMAWIEQKLLALDAR